MAEIPTAHLPHTVTVEPLTGRSSHGDAFGTPDTIPCLIRLGRFRVLTTTGQHSTVQARVTAQLSAGTTPLGSRVTLHTATLGDVEGRVEQVNVAEDGGMGAWQHARLMVATR